MEEKNVNMAEPMNGGVEYGKAEALPTKVNVWTKIKNPILGFYKEKYLA